MPLFYSGKKPRLKSKKFYWSSPAGIDYAKSVAFTGGHQKLTRGPFGAALGISGVTRQQSSRSIHLLSGSAVGRIAEQFSSAVPSARTQRPVLSAANRFVQRRAAGRDRAEEVSSGTAIDPSPSNPGKRQELTVRQWFDLLGMAARPIVSAPGLGKPHF